MAAFRRVALLCAALILITCSPGEGVEPPLDRIYFPVGLALNGAAAPGLTPRNASRLYVANSNFDLQFNGGSLQSYDLARIRTLAREFGPRYSCTSDADCVGKCNGAAECSCGNAQDPALKSWCMRDVTKPCGDFGIRSAADRVSFPGVCEAVDTVHPQDGGGSLLSHAIKIGAFATDVIFRARLAGEPGEGRLFVPVRADSTLHWIDASRDGVMDCGQTNNGGECDDYHRSGDDPEQENTRGLVLPPEPYGIDATEAGDAIVISHQTEGKVSLFVQDAEFQQAPRLEFVQEGLPLRPIGVAAIPQPMLATRAPEERVSNYQQGFYVTFRNSPEVDVLRYSSDSNSTPPRPFLWLSAVEPIRVNSLGYDSRGIAVDAEKRRTCETHCNADDVECLKSCAGIPLKIYVVNRTPETLLIGETRANRSETFSDDRPLFSGTVDLTFGPSRVVVGKIIDTQGRLATRVFVLCFDAHVIYGYDPEARIVDTRIVTGRGPYALAIDADVENAAPEHALGYVGHFTDSYIGVIDLDQRHSTYGSIVLTLGKPTPPRASK